jgi:hypothetical protein
MALRAWNPAELHDLAANLKDRQTRLAAKRATLAANVRKPAPRRFRLDWRVVLGVLAIASWPWLG